MASAEHKRHLLVGLGRSGLACLRFLLERGERVDVTDAAAELPALEEASLRDRDIGRCLGELRAPRPIDEYASLLLSPGIAPDSDIVRAARDAGVEVINEIELYARQVQVPVIAVTGSNGKSTVVSMLGHVGEALGLRIGVGGNIGTPALELLAGEFAAHVLELSSFQLELVTGLRTRTAIVLNLSEDHLDRHASLAEYARIKQRIYRECDRPLVNRGDSLAAGGIEAWASIGEGEAGGDESWGLIEREGSTWICRGDRGLLDAGRLRVAGRHNAFNAMAALALLDAAGFDAEAAAEALTGFAGLPHRCQWVGRFDEVDWYDDSKGTNVGSTLAALNGLPAPIIWLGGGVGKGQDFSPIGPVLGARGKAAVTFGRDGGRIAEALQGHLPVHREADLGSSVRRARALAAPGDTVLLSPACASFDQFSGYEARGRAFADAVKAVHA